MKIKIKGKSEASRLKPVLRGAPPIPLGVRDAFCGTGFSREEAIAGAGILGLAKTTDADRAHAPRGMHPLTLRVTASLEGD